MEVAIQTDERRNDNEKMDYFSRAYPTTMCRHRRYCLSCLSMLDQNQLETEWKTSLLRTYQERDFSMTNPEFLKVFTNQVRRINLAPKKTLERWRREGILFEASWSAKGEAERRAKKRGVVLK